jgi:hypothetical protein
VGKLSYANECPVNSRMLGMMRVVAFVELLQSPEDWQSLPLQSWQALNLSPYCPADLVKEGLGEYALISASDEVRKKCVGVKRLVPKEIESQPVCHCEGRSASRWMVGEGDGVVLPKSRQDPADRVSDLYVQDSCSRISNDPWRTSGSSSPSIPG